MACHICLGGHFASFAYPHLVRDFPQVDSILIGEAEHALPLLVERVLEHRPFDDVPGLVDVGQYADVPYEVRPSPIDDLDLLPFPARDYTPQLIARGEPVAVSTSRGCYGTCTFCSVTPYYRRFARRKWRARSIGNVVQELEALRSRHQARSVLFIDDNFVGSGRRGRRRARELAQAIVEAGLDQSYQFDCRVDDVEPDLFRLWRRAGLRHVLLGVESVVEKDLALYRKHITPEQIRRAIYILDELGITYTLGFILFNPTTRPEDIVTNLAFCREIGYTPRNLTSMLNVYPGTPMEHILEERGSLHGPYHRYTFDFEVPETGLILRLAKGFGKQVLKRELVLRSTRDERSAALEAQLWALKMEFLDEVARRIACGADRRTLERAVEGAGRHLSRLDGEIKELLAEFHFTVPVGEEVRRGV
jgi:radical SAM superfamily enzyme YgiQ (UPF0313 family)